MKKIILAITVIASFTSCKKSNNDSQTTPPVPAVDTLMSWTKSAKLFLATEDVWFTSSGTGFLVANPTASSESIYTSSDLGVTWTMVPNTEGAGGYNLQFLNDQIGFAQGQSNIAFTNDGGKTWSIKKLPSSNGIYSQFISGQTGFFADKNGGISKTVDGGNTWSPVIGYLHAGETFPFYFIDSLRGYTMAEGNFSKTTDGGMNWQKVTAGVVPPVNSGHFYKMQMFDTLTGFCGTSQGLLKTVDGGQTWTNSLGDSSNFTIFQFLDRDNGYATIQGSIFKTTDGGQTWNLSCELGADSFNGIHFLDMDHGWACTSDGYILKLN
jgi:photosystem II stability/assembly factor-like uncharacterized protein